MEAFIDLNTSAMSCTKEELVQANEILKTKMVQMQQDLDSKKQLVHDLQREVARVSALEADYLQELDAVQSQDNMKSRQLEEKLLEVTKEKLTMEKDCKERIDFLETQINAKENFIKELEEKQKSNSVLAESVVITQIEYDKLINENSMLNEQVERLAENHGDLEKENNHLKEINRSTNVALESSKTMFDQLYEDNKVKKQELQEAKELNETLQEDMALLRCEMETVRNKPLDSELRGNSLFAEVDDRRVQLQKNVSCMKKQYLSLKREHVILLDQITNLKTKNTEISRRWEEDMAQRERDYLNPVYTNRIATLEELVKKQKELLDNQPKSTREESESVEVNYLENLLVLKQKEFEALMEKVNKDSLTRVLTSRELFQKNIELGQVKSKCARLECEVSQVKTQMELLKLSGPEARSPDCKCEVNKEGKSRFTIIDFAKKKNASKSNSEDKQRPNIFSLLTPKTETDFKQPGAPGNSELQKPKVLSSLCSVTTETNCKQDGLGSEEVQKPLSPLRTSKTETDCKLSGNDEQGKENKPEKKSVKFTEDTIDANVTNRKKMRRRGVIISCPKVYIPSVVKNDG